MTSESLIYAKDPHLLSIYDQLKEWTTGEEPLDPSNISKFVAKLISVIELEFVFDVVTGEYKKNIAILVLQLIIKESDITDSEKDFLYKILQNTVPTMIDTMCDIAKGKINLYKVIKKVKKRIFNFSWLSKK